MYGGGGSDWMDGSPRRGDSPATNSAAGGSGRRKERGSLVLPDEVIATLTRLENALISEANGTGTVGDYFIKNDNDSNRVTE